jgi:TonB-linked SusC/RagA family outer membrane protein
MSVKNLGCALLLLLVPLSLHGQSTGQITGLITSDALQPLQGVEVTVEGTPLRATTGANGRFTIANVPAGEHVVRASTVGYAAVDSTVTVQAGTPTVVDFQLATRAVELSELVVVGYGTQQRGEVTGAVASVSAADFVKGPARDAAALIAGKVAGLSVVQPSGDPTEGTQIQLRGRTTIQGPTNPLVLIDGVPGSLETVPADDIESISVLKDGSAAAVYGTRGSNGVILITTKRYVGGAPTLRYDGFVSQSTIYNSPDFLTAGDVRRLIADGYETPAGATFQDLGYDTNWQDAMLRNPISHRHNLTLSGGATNTNYTASVNYEDAQGIFNRSDNRELTARANIRHSMFDGKLEAEANLLSRTENNFTGPSFDYAWRQTLIRNPTDRVRDDEGDWQEREGYFYVNPVVLVEEENGEFEERTTRLNGTLSFRPIDQLRFSLMANTTRSSSLSGSATTFRHSNNTQGNNGGAANRNTESEVDRIIELTGTFNDQLGAHNVTLLGGYSYQDNVEEDFFASNTRFPSDLFDWNQLQRGTGLLEGEPGTGISSGKEDYKLIGFFGRLNYDWNDRYLLMGSIRYEGNSRFGADHQWGLFPAVSAGWRISEESFMDGVGFLDDLRLRAGYGVTGIAPDDSYLSLTTYEYDDNFLNNGEWVQELEPTRNPNNDLRWEEKQELNVGLNFSLFDFRLSGALDVYRRETKDMLYNYSVPVPPYQIGSILANVGTMRNSGVEVELSYDVISRPGLRWTTSANWSRNSNELVTLSDDTFQEDDCFNAGGTGEPIQTSTHRVCVGEPIGNFYGFKSVDIDENGVWIVLDSAGERISIRDATFGRDRHILGNGIPKQLFAWNNTAQIGSFDLSVNVRGAADFQILNYMRMYYENPTVVQYNMLQSAFDPVYGKQMLNHDLSYVSYYVEDGDYVKLDNVTLGYTFGPQMLGLLSDVLSNARIYLSGRNLLTLTGYKGLDPEVETSGLTPGEDQRDTYPTTRLFTAGVTFTF